MEIRTNVFRYVWRIVNDGNGDMKVLLLQQWITYTDTDPEIGYWDDIPITKE